MLQWLQRVLGLQSPQAENHAENKPLPEAPIQENPFPLDELPDDMLLEIMQYLPLKDIGKVAKRYNTLAKNEQIQRAQLQRHFPAALKQLESKTPPFDYQACFNNATKEQYKNLSPWQKELLYYTKEGNLQAIKNLIEKLPSIDLLEIRDIHGYTIIDWAYMNRHQAVLDYFYQERFQKASYYKNLPLHWAILCYQSTIVVSARINNKADIQAACDEGTTPLWIAAHRGHLDVVKLLLENKADIDAAPNDDSTPLWVAAQNGHVDVVKLLLDKKADINAVRNSGATPLYIAAQNGHVDVVKLLLENGADVHAAHNDDRTPLWVAAEKGHVKVVQLLFDKGAGIPAVRNSSATLLWFAAQKGHVDVVQLLLENGANIHAAHNSDATPLYIAAQEGHVAVVKLLLEKKPNVNAAHNSGSTPLYIAAYNGHVDVVKLLLSNGARLHVDQNNHHIPDDIQNPEIILLLGQKNNQSTNTISGKALQIIYRQYQGSFFKTNSLFSKNNYYSYQDLLNILQLRANKNPGGASAKTLELLQKHYSPQSPQEKSSPIPRVG